MKVKQLIKKLQKHDPEKIVIMSKDSEGNYFSPLADMSKENYIPETTWAGELGSGGEPALVLWPTN